ncbi:hypothetical protein SDC9_202629 [bioreactor metagenome]|uniref:Uncharacterized protein n=1 Tax=bioreactor metagenome TaxID=1076179 RepID=A0A645IVP0_9ZZZZ
MFVQYTTVERTKSTEGICTKQGFGFLHISHHCLRPMHHGCHIKLKGVFTDTHFIQILHLYHITGYPVKSFQHLYGSLVPHNLDIRIFGDKEFYRTGMVRLHMIHHQIVDSLIPQY